MNILHLYRFFFSWIHPQRYSFGSIFWCLIHVCTIQVSWVMLQQQSYTCQSHLFNKQQKKDLEFKWLSMWVCYSLIPILLCCVKVLQGCSLQRGDSGIPAGSSLASVNGAVGRELEVVQGLFIASACQLHPHPLIRTSHVFICNCNGCWEVCLLRVQYTKEHHCWWALRSTPAVRLCTVSLV